MSDSRSFEVLLGHHFSHLEVRNFSERTLDLMRVNLGAFAAWCGERGMYSPLEVTRDVVEKYQRWLFHYRQKSGKPLAASTQSRKLSCIRTFFSYLVKERYLLYDPTSAIELPKVSRRIPTEIFSLEEIEQIMNYPDITTAYGMRNRAMLEVLHSTGVRRSELANLDVYDVNPDHGYLSVRHGKGDKDRVVPIGDRALAWVMKYVEEGRPELLLSAYDPVLFVNTHGVRFRGKAIGSVIQRILDYSGVRKRRGACHLFRHTMATMMLEGGADIRFVQEMLGHAKLETTKIYTKVSIAKLKAVHTASHPSAELNRRVETEDAEEIN